MAAVLSRNLSDIKKITIFMDDCRRAGIQVLGPDVNESNYKFTVMPNGDIRFGLGAIKGVGEGAVINIIETRKKQGRFTDIYDFAEKVNLQSVNKKNFEALAVAGAFDDLGKMKRSQFFAVDTKGVSFVENIMRYGAKAQSEKNNVQQTLFGGTASGFEIQKPEIPQVEEWSMLEKLSKEKEVIGIYLSAHPLDDYKLEIESFCNTKLSQMDNLKVLLGKDITIAGIVSDAKILNTKKGTHYGKLTLEDFTDSWELTLFGKDFMENRKFFFDGYSILIKGRVEPNKFRNNEPELSVKSIHMLSEVKDDMIKLLTISIPINEVTDELVEELRSISATNKGKVSLKFKLVDSESNISLEMFSRTHRVAISSELIGHLRKMDLNFKVN
jgi:DNA polymerase-3 subunit alpha